MNEYIARPKFSPIRILTNPLFKKTNSINSFIMYGLNSATHNKKIPPKNIFKDREHQFLRISHHYYYFIELVRLFFVMAGCSWH